MMTRITQCIAALVVGLIGLLAFLDNANNLQSGFAAVQYVVSEAEQPVYKNFGPAINSPISSLGNFPFHYGRGTGGRCARFLGPDQHDPELGR